MVIRFIRPDHQIRASRNGFVDDDPRLRRVDAYGRCVSGNRSGFPYLLIVRKIDFKEPEVILKFAFIDLEIAADQHKDQIAFFIGIEHGFQIRDEFAAEKSGDLVDGLAAGRMNFFQRQFLADLLEFQPGNRDLTVRLVAFAVG